MLKGQKGITLVALVITIVVLIILAGVSISLVMGNEGIFQKTKDAADAYQNSADRESTEWANIQAWLEPYLNNIGTSTQTNTL